MTPLLEREEALATLAEAVAGVGESSGGTLLFVGGEAGVGKTALLRLFAEAHAHPARVLWGACDALFTPRPLGPFLDMAETAGGELRALMAGGAMPHEVASVLAGEPAREGPTVVVLEDVHWAHFALGSRR